MKVLYVIPGLGVGGGAERSLLDLAPGLRERGIDLSVAYFHERPSSAVAAFRAAGVPTDRIDEPNWTGRLRALHRAIRRERPAIVHTTLFEADVLGRLAALGTRAKVVSSLVSTPYDPARRVDPAYSGWRVGLVRTLDGATLRWGCDVVHANSEAVKASAVARLHARPERVTVIPRGRDPEAMRPADADRRATARATLGIDPDVPVVLMVGRQEPTKDHATLLAAVAPIAAERPDLVVLLAGRDGGATPQVVADLDRLGLEDVVRCLGFRTDVPDLLAAADVFAFPSLLEGMPGAVIEAMASEVPIVAARIAPVQELVDESMALLVPPGDHVAMEAALRATLDDPAAAALRARAARVRFEARFTLASVLEATVALYRSVAA